MNPKPLINRLMVIGIGIGLLLLIYYQFISPQLNPGIEQVNLNGWKIPDLALTGGSVSSADAYSRLRSAGGQVKGLPVRLRIPKIGVNTAIEDAYITADGRMDVPAGSVNVAWYAAGAIPGQSGSAVIGGHYGIDRGVPRVFYGLKTLVPGDRVYIENDRKETLVFNVDRVKVFNRNDNTREVFLSGDGKAHLNLITCDGVWNQRDNTYRDRRVVFTTAVQ